MDPRTTRCDAVWTSSFADQPGLCWNSVHISRPTRSTTRYCVRSDFPGWPNSCAACMVWEVIVRGARIPAEPCVVVANHLSYIDPLAIVSLVPSVPIAKTEVRGWPLIGELMNQLGVLFVQREDPYSGAQVLRDSMVALRRGLSVLAFPEGTTTTGEVLPFRRGMFGVAQHTGAPIVPIALRYESEELCWVGNDPFLPHYLRTTARSRTRLEVTICPPSIQVRGPVQNRSHSKHTRRSARHCSTGSLNVASVRAQASRDGRTSPYPRPPG